MLGSCGIYKPYSRPDIKTDNLFGEGIETPDSTSIGDIKWQDMFTDPYLQALIEQGLANNTDLQAAHWKIQEAEASLKTARLSFFPSFNFAPQGGLNYVNQMNTSWTYSLPVTASWEIDVFGRILNGKRQAKAVYEQSKDYRQAVKTQLVASIANLYYTLLMLDEQYTISEQTASKWSESVETMRAMMDAGMTNSAGVAQTEASYYSILSSLKDIQYSIKETENSLASLLGDVPQTFKRGKLADQTVPSELTVGVPVQLLANRPDVRSAEQNLIMSYYATSEARSSLYPSLKLTGSMGWTNNIGQIINPGKWLLSAAGSLTQPIFNAGANRARVKIAEAQQEEAKLSFQQTLLNAGAEVNNALTQCQTARGKEEYRNKQIASLETAVESTQLLMRHGNSTYLEVLTAQQALLSAQLSQVSDKFDEIQGVVNLYHALGGGRDLE